MRRAAIAISTGRRARPPASAQGSLAAIIRRYGQSRQRRAIELGSDDKRRVKRRRFITLERVRHGLTMGGWAAFGDDASSDTGLCSTPPASRDYLSISRC